MCGCDCGNCGLGALDRVYGLGLVSAGFFRTPTTATGTVTLPPGEEGPIPMPGLPLPPELGPAPVRDQSTGGALPIRAPVPGEGVPFPMPGLPLPPDLPPAPGRSTPTGGGAFPVRSRTTSPAPMVVAPDTSSIPEIPQAFPTARSFTGFPWKWVLILGGGLLLYQEFGGKGRRRR